MKPYDIIFTVTNDLSYDQRMQKICGSLSADANVLLVGRRRTDSIALSPQLFQQKRLNCFFDKGMLFYAEYNIRLFLFLLITPCKKYCAIDLDTILPVLFASWLFKRVRVYDAHELFTEQKEVMTRPTIHAFWLWVERFAVPKFKYGYTVNQFIQKEFEKRYGVQYGLIANMPKLENYHQFINTIQTEKYILYQGAVNEGRAFETLIPAMKWVDCKLIICGNGNLFDKVKALIEYYHLSDKIKLKGYVEPEALKQYTANAYIGLTLFEATGMNQYYSLANRFFDYIMAEIPQLCVNYPEYKKINDQYGIAYTIEDTKAETIAAALNNMLNNDVAYQQLKQNTLAAKQQLCWNNQEEKLKHNWKNIYI